MEVNLDERMVLFLIQGGIKWCSLGMLLIVSGDGNRGENDGGK